MPIYLNPPSPYDRSTVSHVNDFNVSESSSSNNMLVSKKNQAALITHSVSLTDTGSSSDLITNHSNIQQLGPIPFSHRQGSNAIPHNLPLGSLSVHASQADANILTASLAHQGHQGHQGSL